MPNVACPQGAALGDGCGGQIPGASFQRNPASFPDYATGYDPTITATGLTRAGNIRAALAGTGAFAPNPINFNLPGVQYPIGDNPAIEVQAQNYAAQVGFPTGCSYQTTGGGVNLTSPRVYCTQAASNPTFNNIDFTNGGTDCVTLETFGGSGGVTGVITVNNARFQYRNKCTGAPGKSNAYLVNIGAPSTNLTGFVLKNVFIDGNPFDCAGCLTHPLSADVFFAPTATAQFSADYVAAINNLGRFVSGGTTTTGYSIGLYVTHSYMEGASLGCLAYGQHGELTSLNSGASSTGNVNRWSYNTIVIPPWQPFYPFVSQFKGDGCLTAPLYFAGGAATTASWSVDEDHALSITNLPGSLHSTATAATVEIGYSIYPNASDVTVTSVWADPAGTTQCAASTSGPTGTGSTNPVMNIIDLYDGSVITNFDAAPKCAGHANP